MTQELMVITNLVASVTFVCTTLIMVFVGFINVVKFEVWIVMNELLVGGLAGYVFNY